MITDIQLSKIIPNNINTKAWAQALTMILPEYGIDTPLRVAAFVAQCAHESSEFRILKENLNYRWESLRRVFPKYFPTDALAIEYQHKPDRIANKVYGNRMGNGPEGSGDGYAFSGRGLIQLTGKTNYQLFADSIEIPIKDVPAYLLTYEGAVSSAAFFWETNNLNQLADAKDIVALTKKINGGTIGLESRTAYYTTALKVLL